LSHLLEPQKDRFAGETEMEWLTDRGTSTCALRKSPPPVNTLAWLGETEIVGARERCCDVERRTEQGKKLCSNVDVPTLVWSLCIKHSVTGNNIVILSVA
jgi:hypothetical protein